MRQEQYQLWRAHQRTNREGAKAAKLDRFSKSETSQFQVNEHPANIERIGAAIVDCSIAVHRELGPGLLENAYEFCLSHALKKRGFSVECQRSLPITYDGETLDVGYRLDLIVENMVVIEAKAVEQLLPVHHAQVLTYLKLSGCTLGYLINFNVPLLKEGLKRIVLNHPPSP